MARWLEEAATGPVTVLCASAPDSRAEGRLAVRLDTCLAAVAPYRLIDLALAAGSPLVMVGGCAGSCRGPEALGWLVEVVGPQVLLTQGAGVRGPVVDLADPPVTRRELFSLLTPAAPIHRADTAEERLVESLRRAGIARSATESLAWDLAAVGCTACGVCVHTCPHEALTLGEFGSKAVLVQAPELCQGEGDCVAACPVQALASRGRLSWGTVVAGPRRLADVVTRRCEKCGARIIEGDLCELCAWRRENPFGFAVPPRFRQQDGMLKAEEGES